MVVFTRGMSSTCDRQKQVRLETRVYRQLRAIQRHAKVRVTLSALANYGITASLPVLARNFMRK